MNIETYLAALDAKLREVEGLVASTSIQREIDANLGMGFIKGRIAFVDGSTLEFSEQLPTDRRKYRVHYMDTQNNLIARWDSAPHHKELSTFPFHKHTPQGVEEHRAITLLEALDEIAKLLQV
jgi:hypothetical protein